MTAPSDEHVDGSVRYIREKVSGKPDIAVVLGSGLGTFAEGLPDGRQLSTSEIPHYPVSSVEGHKGRLIFAELDGRRVLVFQGRIHLYESNDLAKVLHPVAVAGRLGVRTLIVTNAAGGINREFSPGDLMLISDQIDLTGEFLPGKRPGIRNVPLYDPELLIHASDLAASHGIQLKRGVYAAVMGPSYETAAEVEMIYRLGGDAVGMSTVKEVLFASQLGMRILGISCITNKGTGIGTNRLNHAEVTEVANRVTRDFTTLLRNLLATL
jgi:purine-nucleoside phosphorylase